MPRKHPKRKGLKKPIILCDCCHKPADSLHPDPRYKNAPLERQKFCCFKCKEKLEGKGGEEND